MGGDITSERTSQLGERFTGLRGGLSYGDGGRNGTFVPECPVWDLRRCYGPQLPFQIMRSP